MVRINMRSIERHAAPPSLIAVLVPALALCATPAPLAAQGRPATEFSEPPSAPPECPASCVYFGPAVELGAGWYRTYARVEQQAPVAVGVVFDDAALSDLPAEPHDGTRCFDVDEDRRIQTDRECVGGHERVLFMPSFRVRLDVTPWTSESREPVFHWLLLNWHPTGHSPRNAWGVPHFDFHFFIQSLVERNRIKMGPCALLVDCADLEVGRRHVPSEFLPPGYADRGIVEFAMGNHLIDTSSPALPEPLTHTFIYGSWAGKISFYEPMVSLATLQEAREGKLQPRCFPIPQPQAWELPGHYPTKYCVDYDVSRGEFTVSLEGFVARTSAG